MPRSLLLSITLSVVALATAAVAQPIAETPVSEPVYGAAPPGQTNPTVASDGQNFLVVWHDERNFPESVAYAARVSSSGELLDPTGIRLTVGGLVVYSGGAYVVIGGSYSQLVATRISREGQIIDGPRVIADHALVNPDFGVASNGSRIVVLAADRLFIFDADANLLERDVLLLTGGSFPGRPALIASNGTDFLLTWRVSYADSALRALRLDHNGHPAGDPTIVAADGTPDGIASNGSDYLIVSANTVQEVDATGHPVGEPHAAPTTFGDLGRSLVWAGNQYVMAVSRQNGIAAIRFQPDGTPIDSEAKTILPSALNGFVTLAASSGQLLLTWSFGNIFALPLHATDLSRTHDPTLVSRSAPAQEKPSIASSGRNLLVAWQEKDSIICGRISEDGQPLDGAGIRVSSSPYVYNPRVTYDGQHYIVAWRSFESRPPQGREAFIMRFSRIDPDSGEDLDPGGRDVIGSEDVDSFDVASNGDQTLLAFAAGALTIVAINREGFVVNQATVPPKESIARPSVGWNGTEWLVAFEQRFLTRSIFPFFFRSDVYSVRLSPLLTLLDPQPIPVAVTQYEDNYGAHVASDGNDFVVAWTLLGCFDTDGAPDQRGRRSWRNGRSPRRFCHLAGVGR